MTYTAGNPHVCCNWPRPKDAHTAALPPPHPHKSTHLTNNNRLCWKTDGRPPANGPPKTTPQQRRHSPSTPARGPPRPPTPRPSPQLPTPPSQSQGQVPITDQNFCTGDHSRTAPVNIMMRDSVCLFIDERAVDEVHGYLKHLFYRVCVAHTSFLKVLARVCCSRRPDWYSIQ